MADVIAGWVINNGVCQGRLTLESGVPISTSDQTSKTTIYWTPFKGNMIALYNGTSWSYLTFSETSIALGTLTSGKNYDVFAYNNAGTLALEFSSAWTSDTARNDAVVLQDGVYVKSGATTRRYLGTFRTTSTTTTEDSGGGSTTQVGGKRFVWNLYNQVPRYMGVIDTTDSWSYATGTWRQANAATGNKVEFIVGLSGYAQLDAMVVASLGMISTSARASNLAVGYDSTSSPTGVRGRASVASGNANLTMVGSYRTRPTIGYHYAAWLEYGGDGTVVWNGDAGDQTQSGMSCQIEC